MPQHPDTRPFADAVVAYAQAGWPCILPVPADKKWPPPVGFTGAEGRDTDPMQLVTWAGSHAGHAIALRTPDGVIGIDVDHYDKTTTTPDGPRTVRKRGADTLADFETRWGPLPRTWSSTARGDGRGPGPSRILFFRVPAGRYATRLGDAIEIIQRHHRYAVVAPSPHPETGSTYGWYDPANRPVHDVVPKPIEFPWMPDAWVRGLAEGATEAGPAAADLASGYALLEQVLADTRPACAEVTSAALTAQGQLSAAGSGSRHDTATARVHHLVQLGAAGHPGAGSALVEVRRQWAALTAGEERSAEFERMMLTSARKAVTAIGGVRPVDRDPCFSIGCVPMAAPAPVDDRPGHDQPEPIEPPRELHPFEIIGAHEFDPRGHLDQSLADAVLHRIQPVLRYAHDARIWLLRGPEVWDSRPDLSGWAVALLADRMPHGDPEAEKGSPARDQADRRKRFMTATPSRGIATKMRDRVAGGVHPSTLKITNLDREPWLLWAGGVAWDLRESGERPTPAGIDPATPHRHSAGVVPDVRPTPLWDAFLAAVWPDPDLRVWALRVLSIAVTGYSDKAVPILIGETDRGKTQVIALLMSVLGSYAHAADPRLLGGADKAHASIIFALMGRRLSFIDEGPRDGRLGQERLKQLTGGGELTGNAMNQNPVTWAPTHTLVLTANDEPTLTDPAVRGRVRLIPCEGDPKQVIAARAAIGSPNERTWRREAPGALAQMMREAAAWLADPASALTSAAPAAYRHRAEEIAAEQDPIASWIEEETEPDDVGERSRSLYEAFAAWARIGKPAGWQAPSETKWGRELNRRGFSARHTETGKRRPLRLRQRGGWLSTNGPVPAAGNTPNPSEPAPATLGPVPANTPAADGLGPNPDGLLTGSPTNPSGENPQVTAGFSGNPDGLTGSHPFLRVRARTHAHVGAGEKKPVNPSTRQDPQVSGLTPAGEPVSNPSAAPQNNHESDKPAPQPVSRRPTRHSDPPLAKITKAARKEAQREAAKLAAAGEAVSLPVAVDRAGTITPLDAAQAGTQIAAAITRAGALTVDVETTGYPVGHRHYGLRTIQLGDDQAAIVLDAADPAQIRIASLALAAAPRLHAHSATADLVPLADAGLIDPESAWTKMYDTVIPAKLADPASTGSDPGLKKLAHAVLGEHATAPAADADRTALFTAGRWLTDTTMTTPVERSGWAQVDMHRTTMVRYGAADVLDTAALAQRLPAVDPAELHRERTAQRMTARVAHQGLRIDGVHVAELHAQHTALHAAAAERVRALGIDNPRSKRQVAAALAERHAALPRTPPSAKYPQGQPSVAEGVLDPLLRTHPKGSPVHDLVTAVLEFRHHDTAIGTFLEPYQQLVQHGDGRARPTIYTLAADTGRMSCVRPNLQQVPRQGGFRACITADPGHLLVSADFSSVELRVAAALSGDQDLYRIITEADAEPDKKNDLHWRIAREVFGPDATKADRYAAKRVVFGRLYGAGVPTLARQAGVTESVAQSAVDVLDATTPGLIAWSHQIRQAVRAGRTQFPTYAGRTIHLPLAYTHKAPNYCIQGTARELLVDALLRWADTRWGTAVLLPVHDEIVTVIPEDDAADATAALVTAMQTDLYGVQIKADPSTPTFAWADSS